MTAVHRAVEAASILLTPWGIFFDIYVLLQIFCAVAYQGWWRVLALVPVPLMGWVAYVTVHGYVQGSNLWPIVLIVVSPLAAGYLGRWHSSE